MMRGRWIETGAALAVLIATAVVPPAVSEAAAQGAGAAVPAQPSVDLPTDLERVLRDYERFWGAGEEDELAALFVEDGLIVRDGGWIRGRDRIREAYRNASGPLRLRAIEYAANDDLGYIVGAYGYGDGDPASDVGMFVLTLRRGPDGAWLIVSDLDRGAG